MQLKAVVLPEPLGPISAVILRATTSNEQFCRARTPPKDLSTPRTCSDRLFPSAMGMTPSSSCLLIAPRSGPGGLARDNRHRLPARRRPPCDQLLRGDQKSIWHEPRDQHQHHTEQRQGD